MNVTRDMLFFCYDAELHIQLINKNIRFICTAISNSGRRFWLYPRNEEVTNVIDEYYKNKNLINK